MALILIILIFLVLLTVNKHIRLKSANNSFSTSNITGSEFYDSVNISLIGTKDSSIYTDTASYPYLLSTFTGFGLPINVPTIILDFYVNQGTIEGYAETSINSSGQQKLDWTIYGLNLSASNVFFSTWHSSK